LRSVIYLNSLFLFLGFPCPIKPGATFNIHRSSWCVFLLVKVTTVDTTHQSLHLTPSDLMWSDLMYIDRERQVTFISSIGEPWIERVSGIALHLRSELLRAILSLHISTELKKTYELILLIKPHSCINLCVNGGGKEMN
jgi:hypothetical protein